MKIIDLATYLRDAGLIVAIESIETNRGGRHCIRAWLDAEVQARDSAQGCTHAFVAFQEVPGQTCEPSERLIDLTGLVVLFPSGIRIRYLDSTARSVNDQRADFVDHCLAVAQVAAAAF